MMQHDHEPQWSWKSATWGIILALVIVWMFTAPWALAATIEVRPGDNLQAVHDAAQPGDTLRITGRHTEQAVRISKALTIECTPDALLDGQRNGRYALEVRTDDVTVRNCRIANYINGGIRTKYAFRFLIENNTIQQIGSKWGCGDDVPTCVGYGGVHVTDSKNGIVRNNHMSDIRNHAEDDGKVHCIYASRVEQIELDGNTCIGSTGDMYKLRSAFKTKWRRNRCVDGPLCFVTGVPDRLADEEPRSRDNELWLNKGYDMDGFIKCRGEGQGDDSYENCSKYDVIVNGAQHWTVKTVEVIEPEPERNPARPLKCPTGKKVRNLNGERDCNKCFPGSSDKRKCRQQCLPPDSKSKRHQCARELM